MKSATIKKARRGRWPDRVAKPASEVDYLGWLLDPQGLMVKVLRRKGIDFDLRRVALMHVDHDPGCNSRQDRVHLTEETVDGWCDCLPRVTLAVRKSQP